MKHVMQNRLPQNRQFECQRDTKVTLIQNNLLDQLTSHTTSSLKPNMLLTKRISSGRSTQYKLLSNDYMVNVMNDASCRSKCNHHELPCHILLHSPRSYNSNSYFSKRLYYSRADYIQVRENVAEINEKNGQLTVCFMQTTPIVFRKQEGGEVMGKKNGVNN